MDKKITEKRIVPLLSIRPTGKFKLTSREGEILCWVALGKKNKEIGMILKVCPKTVAKHIEHIKGKLGAKSRTEAVVCYFGLESLKIRYWPGIPRRKVRSKVLSASMLPQIAQKWGMSGYEKKNINIFPK